MDFSTINLDALRRLPTYVLPPSYTLQREPGNGCAFDPPGFPTYFTRAVYTRNGNSPHKGPEMVITFEGKHYVVAHSDDWKHAKGSEAVYAKRQARMRKLWKPLPADHERTLHWMASVYKHQGEGYRLGSMVGDYGRGTETLYVQKGEVAYWQEHKIFGHERFKKFSARCDSKGWERRVIRRYLLAHVKPENLVAVHIIREHYPEHQPSPELAQKYAKAHGNVPTWWETDAEAPTPETCHPRSMGPHPINGSWCQNCGWIEQQEAAA